jgi:hypothetical protein
MSEVEVSPTDASACDEPAEAEAEGVVVAWVRPSHVNGEFMESVLGLVDYESTRGPKHVTGGRGGFVSQVSSANVSAARNEVCEKFLKYSSAPWLLFLDSDMTFEPDTVEKLLEFADEDKAPIIGGLCFTLSETAELEPTLYDVVGTLERPEFIRYKRFPLDSMFEVHATGAACLLIHRSVLARVRDFRTPKRPGMVGFSDAYPWFQETDFYGRRMSEDITFCFRAGFAGIPIWVNTAVKLGHIKTFSLTYDRYMAQQAIIEAQREAERRSADEDERVAS